MVVEHPAANTFVCSEQAELQFDVNPVKNREH
jgi:hypothetical protein